MTAFLSDRDARIIVWSLRICGIACWIVALVLICMTIQEAGAVELSIIGSSIGQGAHIVSFSGDCLNASIVQGLNSSSWNVTAVVPA
jgi:hypothetical protein